MRFPVTKGPITRFEELAPYLLGRAGHPTPCIVAIDGRGGSGKSSLSRELARRLGSASIIPMDNFFHPSTHQPTLPPADQETGAAFDLLRLRAFLTILRMGRPSTYRRYDWVSDSLAEAVEILPSRVVLVEGVYSTCAFLHGLYDIALWIECPPAVCLARGIARDGEQMRERWEREWGIQEECYIQREDPVSRADIVLDGSGTAGGECIPSQSR